MAPVSHFRRDKPSSAASPHPFVRGMRLGLPIFLGYAPVGMAFGVLSRGLGFSVVESTICSATALAGAGQFIALSILGTGAGAISALIATTVVNLRYVLFATTLSPHVARFSRRSFPLLGFSLTDETFAVNISDLKQGMATAPSMVGVGFIAWLGWVSGTVVGAVAADWVGDPSRFGVEFAMPAMFAALFVALAENRAHVVVGIFAGAIALLLPLLRSFGIEIPSSWYVVIASIAAATVASVVLKDE